MRSPCAGPATKSRTVGYGIASPNSSSIRATIRRTVCRCLRGASRSACSQASTVFLYGSVRGDVLAGRRRGAGTGDERASLTSRRCTPYFRERARIDSCCQLFRRIRSNSACLDKGIHSTAPAENHRNRLTARVKVRPLCSATTPQRVRATHQLEPLEANMPAPLDNVTATRGQSASRHHLRRLCQWNSHPLSP
jgi:hypothetical protein